MTMAEKTVSILEGNTFVVSDLAGNIDATPVEPHGLFAWDTRFLSRWILTIDGQPLQTLSRDDLDYFSAQFFLVPGTGTVYVDADLSVMRKRSAGNGFREKLLVRNEKSEARDIELRLEAAADFADLFEVKDALSKKGETYQRVEDGRLVLGYQRETFVRETWITSSGPSALDPKGMTFRVHLEPHGEWQATIDVRVPDVLKATPPELNGGEQGAPASDLVREHQCLRAVADEKAAADVQVHDRDHARLIASRKTPFALVESRHS